MCSLSRTMLRFQKRNSLATEFPKTKEVKRAIEKMTNWKRHRWAMAGYRASQAVECSRAVRMTAQLSFTQALMDAQWNIQNAFMIPPELLRGRDDHD